VTTQPTQPENNDTQVTVVEDSSAHNSPSNAGVTEIPASIQIQDNPISVFTAEDAAPSFTALIEEFRQREERMAPQGVINDIPSTDHNEQPAAQAENAPAQEASTHVETPEPESGARDSAPTAPTTKPERPVSPLLRPATRIRMPRQGGGRQRETFVTQGAVPSAAPAPKPEHTTHQASTSAQTPVAQGESPAPAIETAERAVADTTRDTATQEAQVEQSEPPKPARRYRFDRPAPAAHAPVSSKSVSLAPSPSEPVGLRPRPENTAPEQTAKPTNGSALESPSLATGTKSAAPEPVSTPESEVTAPTAPAARPTNDRRRRHSQEGQHVKARVSIDAIKDAVKAETTKAEAVNRVPTGTPVADQPAPQASTETPSDAIHRASTEIPLEDLPPLEYSELQAASRRRRRRRTNGNGATTPPTPAIKPTTQTTASAPLLVGPAPSPIAPVSPVIPSRNIDFSNRAPSATPNTPPTPYTIESGMTVSQMNQGNDAAGPFQGPEPTPARGSVLPSQPRLTRPIRNGNEVQRGSITPLPAVRSGGDGILSTGAVNHLGNVISQAIQTQSDRMVAELRRANQTPTNVSVTLPPFPSAERVGVFVDVANLLYSARTLRITIDFGKLLDFLRGNRRLVRAHAYCPTSPQPGDDQMFLQAVKGLGYRITTKNYKTFASGAKKADMDLDLCMDVVRLVDGGAVDCIVLVSGDGDFIPMLDYCSDHGVRVEVVAFDESMSASLRQSCDLFINLSMLDEIRV
jgi:uncharacterized LabA/DUF88 family protein